MIIRNARDSDLAAIKAITNAGANRAAFDFVMRPVLEAAIADRRANGRLARNALVVATRGGAVIGFLRLYHRQDGTTTLHEIGVLPDVQGHRASAPCFSATPSQPRAPTVTPACASPHRRISRPIAGTVTWASAATVRNKDHVAGCRSTS